MKIRTDFVTNSSSSSFIGVFAKIDNKEKADKTINQLNLSRYVTTGKAILEDMSRKYFWGYGADWAGVDLTPYKDQIDENAEYIVWESYGGAGDDDSDFDIGDYLDYDVDLNDFSDAEQEIYTSINTDNGFGDIDNGYGAGRNG